MAGGEIQNSTNYFSRSSIKRHTSLKNSPIHYISLPPNPYRWKCISRIESLHVFTFPALSPVLASYPPLLSLLFPFHCLPNPSPPSPHTKSSHFLKIQWLPKFPSTENLPRDSPSLPPLLPPTYSPPPLAGLSPSLQIGKLLLRSHFQINCSL